VLVIARDVGGGGGGLTYFCDCPGLHSGQFDALHSLENAHTSNSANQGAMAGVYINNQECLAVVLDVAMMARGG
jgi:hypothetical protein